MRPPARSSGRGPCRSATHMAGGHRRTASANPSTANTYGLRPGPGERAVEAPRGGCRSRPTAWPATAPENSSPASCDEMLTRRPEGSSPREGPAGPTWAGPRSGDKLRDLRRPRWPRTAATGRCGQRLAPRRACLVQRTSARAWSSTRPARPYTSASAAGRAARPSVTNRRPWPGHRRSRQITISRWVGTPRARALRPWPRLRTQGQAGRKRRGDPGPPPRPASSSARRFPSSRQRPEGRGHPDAVRSIRPDPRHKLGPSQVTWGGAGAPLDRPRALAMNRPGPPRAGQKGPGRG